jgi:putative transcriptional regulator
LASTFHFSIAEQYTPYLLRPDTKRNDALHVKITKRNIQESEKEAAMSNLRKFREKAKVTQAALADRVGMTQGAIAHYENGRRTPGLNEARDLVAALNSLGADCTLDQVFPVASVAA